MKQEIKQEENLTIQQGMKQGKNQTIKKEENKSTRILRNKEKNRERRRVSIDLRVDLYKEFKMMAMVQDENIYELVEEAMESFLKKRKNE